MDSTRFHTKEGRLEESLGTSESFITNGDNLTVRKFIGLLQGRAAGSCGHFLFKVKSNIAQLLLDVSDNLSLGSGGEGVTSLSEDLHQVVSEVTASQVKTKDGVGKGITFIDGYCVRNTISRIQNNTSSTTRSIERKNSLDSNIHSGSVESLEHDLSHLLSVGLGVEGSFCKEDRVFLRSYTELIVEGVMPNLLHIIPVCDNTVLNRIFQG